MSELVQNQANSTQFPQTGILFAASFRLLELTVLVCAGAMVPLVKHLWSKQNREAPGRSRDLGPQLQVSESWEKLLGEDANLQVIASMCSCRALSSHLRAARSKVVSIGRGDSVLSWQMKTWPRSFMPFPNLGCMEGVKTQV